MKKGLITLRLWVDDIREPPAGWKWAKSVDEALIWLCQRAQFKNKGCVIDIEVISLDYDAGDYYSMGGNYINILNWLEKKSEKWNIVKMPKFNLHSKNVVGVQNMRAIIEHNGWTEV